MPTKVIRAIRNLGLAGVAVLALLAGAPAAYSATLPTAARAPSCPKSSAHMVVSPLPGTPDASPTTQISVLGPASCQVTRVTVVGARSGKQVLRHPHPYSAGDGASFFPSKPFTPGEDVALQVDRNNAGRKSHLAYHFTVAVPATPSALPGPPPVPNPTLNARSYVSRPDLHPTNVSITTPAAGVASGYVFAAPIRGPGPAGPMFGQYGPLIVDNHGNPVWSQPTPAGTEAFDFRVQRYNGKPVLTWFQGQLSVQGVGYGVYEILDSSYRTIGVVHAGNGYQGDLHEFLITPHATALFTVDATVAHDLTAYGGPANGTLHDTIAQEVDIKTGRVMWEWHSLGHISLADSYAQVQPNVTWDPFHMNSLQVLPDGNILVSERNMWAAYEVIKRNGQLAWRLGGKKSTVQLGPGVGFAWQHDVEQQPNGLISVFDNECCATQTVPPGNPQSRGEVIKLDRNHRTATLVRQYVHGRPLIAGSQGKTQVLSNGNVFVGWGAQSVFSEFNGAGQLLFDGQFVAPVESYRSYRFEWTGHPLTPPAIAVKAGSAGATAVYASWNGATEVASWQVLAGASASSLAPVGSPAPRSGFETMINVPSAGPFFEVQALSASGHVLSTSPAIHA